MTNLELYNFQDNKDLLTEEFTSEAEWLQLRRKGIGGSDIGALMKLNTHSSPLNIYKQKVEGWHEDLSDNVYIKKGKDLEDFILQNYVIPNLSPKGYIVHKPNFMFINSNFPYLRANVDGIAYKPNTPSSENLIIEIKWVSEWAQKNWNSDEYCGIPASYYAQVQLYMAVTGCQNAKLFALFDSEWEVHEYNIPRDELFILQLKATAKKFYEINMNMKIPPMLDSELDKSDVVNALKTTPIEEHIPNAEMSKYASAYKNISKKIKDAEKLEKKLKDNILDLHLKGYKPDDESISVKFSVVSTRRFNATKFKEDHEDLYNQYCEDSEFSKFTIK